MSDKVLLKSLPYLLGVVAAGTGVSIKTDPSAKTAATNGKVVIFPPLPYTGDELAIYALGYLVHEAGHVRSSDFGIFAGRPMSALLKMLVSVLEDIRIERLINGVYPGARYWLNALTRKFVDTQKQGVIDPGAELTVVLFRYLQDWLYESVLGYNAVKGIGEQQRKLWQSKVSPKLADAVEKLAVGAAWSSSTRHVLSAAEEIIKLIEQEAEQANSAQQQQDQQAQQPKADPGGDQADQSGDKGDAGQGDSAEQGDDSQSADPNQMGASDAGVDGDEAGSEVQSGPTDDSAKALGEGDASEGESGDSEDQPAQPGSKGSRDSVQNFAGYAQALESILQTEEIDQGADRGDAIRQEMQESVGANNSGQDSNFSLPNVLPAQGTKSDRVALDRVRQASTALRYRMEEFLQANTMKRYSIAESGKRLTRDAARRLSMCDPRIFQKRTEGQKVDTAIHVLIDISGSMVVENRCAVAVDAALALGLALDDVEGVKFSVSAFPFHSHDVIELVYPGESVRDVAFRFANLSPNGVTPLDKGLLQAHTALMTTPAARRVCLVITDGDPDDRFASEQVVKMGEAEGIEHMAIGIQCHVGHITRNSCIVTELADLPKQLMAMMQSVILLPKAA